MGPKFTHRRYTGYEMLKTAARMNGMGPGLYALYSLRSGWAAALYRATAGLDLVARYGRWKGAIIRGYFRGSHLMLLGVANLMTSEDGEIIHSAAGCITNAKRVTPLGGYGVYDKEIRITPKDFTFRQIHRGPPKVSGGWGVGGVNSVTVRGVGLLGMFQF